MQIVQGKINDRQILYLELNEGVNEFTRMDLRSWVLFVVADDINHPFLESFADLAIDKSLLYMCATGKACSQVHDLFDYVMLGREQTEQRMPDWYQSDDDVLMTTWHHDFDEGFWFVTSVAYYEKFPISTVVVANFTETNYFEKIQELTNKINMGWLPPD